MNNPTPVFHALRPRLQSIAYRMLGTSAEAEDVVQDAWLRWHEAPHGALDSAEAWLVAVTTRLAIDRLRAAKVQRAHYTGIWLPEPLLSDDPASPEQLLDRAQDISLAFMRLLERLSPEARAAFLLHEIFDVDYRDMAQMLDKSEAACRQQVHRARLQLREEKARYAVPAETHRRLLGHLAQAMTRGDMPALRAVLDEDVELLSDGGGKVPSFGKPLWGRQRVAQLFLAAFRRHGPNLRIEMVRLNGEWGLLRFMDGVLESALVFETDGAVIVRILVQRNPDKLALIARHCDAR